MKHFILAGISALTLLACTTPGPGGVAPAAVQAASGPYRLISQEDVARGMPVLAPGGDVKAHLGALIDWAFAPGYVAQRSNLLFDGGLSHLPEDTDIDALAMQLAAEGHANAKLIATGATPGAIQMLADEGNAVARLGLEMNNISYGSLAEKINALNWLRERARTDNDAALALGIFLITQMQTSSFGLMGGDESRTPTLPELQEGVALLKRVATAGVPLDIMMQITDTLSPLTGGAGQADADLRAMLELVVANTKAEPLPEPGSEQDYSFEDPASVTLMYASAARSHLATLVETGKGGPADLERAKTLYQQALASGLDYVSYEALKRLGVDVSKYDDLINTSFEEDAWPDESEPFPTVPEPSPPPQ